MGTVSSCCKRDDTPADQANRNIDVGIYQRPEIATEPIGQNGAPNSQAASGTTDHSANNSSSVPINFIPRTQEPATELTVRYSRTPKNLQLLQQSFSQEDNTEPKRLVHGNTTAGPSNSGISSGSHRHVSENRRAATRIDRTPSASRCIKVVASFDYTARCYDELTFERGDLMLILDEKGLPQYDTWVNAKLLEPPCTKGKIPTNFVAEFNPLSEYQHQWYYGHLDRTDAERLLLSNQNKDFSFLVRLSSAKNISFSLSVRLGDKVAHFPICRNEWNHLYLRQNIAFENLSQLIEHYQTKETIGGFFLKEGCERVGAPQTKGLSSDLVDNWELDRKLLQLEQQLGSGNFGEVFLGKWKNQILVAVKKLKDETNALGDFLREAGALKKLHHSNIVELYGVCTKQEPFYLVTEFMVNGDLKNYLRNGAGRNLSVKKLIDIGVQVASGMAYLEEEHFVHRDLAARNILVGNDDIYKVADFGMSELMECDYYEPTSKKFSRAIRWAAPEVLHCMQFSVKSDVWAFGICLFEIVEKGTKPYPECLQKERVTEKVLNQEIMQAAYMPNCPSKLYGIMQMCWRFMPSDRPTFAQLLDSLVNYWGSEYSMEPFTNLDEEKKAQRITIMLQEGTFGKITRELENLEEVVVRHLEYRKFATPLIAIVDQELFLQTASKMKELQHTNLVEVIDAYVHEDDGVAYIVSEPMLVRTLHDAVSGRYGRDLTVYDSNQLAAQIASAMAYLEANNFVHGNLAARNVFLDSNNKCKIADYGLRRMAECFDLPEEPFPKSVKWTAPEVLRNEKKFTIKSDVWAFGICLFEIIEKGKEPYAGLSAKDAAHAVAASGHRIAFEDMEFCTGKFFSLMQKCWKEDPFMRLSFEEILETLQNLYQ